MLPDNKSVAKRPYCLLLYTQGGDMRMSTIAEKIRILRENREWTQAQLAEKMAISESTVQKWEVEKHTPPLAEIKRLSKVFYTSHKSR